MKVLLDTNTLLYALDKNSKYNKIANNIIENENYELFVSTKNIAEIFAVGSKINIDKNVLIEYYYTRNFRNQHSDIPKQKKF